MHLPLCVSPFPVTLWLTQISCSVSRQVQCLLSWLLISYSPAPSWLRPGLLSSPGFSNVKGKFWTIPCSEKSFEIRCDLLRIMILLWTWPLPVTFPLGPINFQGTDKIFQRSKENNLYFAALWRGAKRFGKSELLLNSDSSANALNVHAPSTTELTFEAFCWSRCNQCNFWEQASPLRPIFL